MLKTVLQHNEYEHPWDGQLFIGWTAKYSKDAKEYDRLIKNAFEQTTFKKLCEVTTNG